MNLISIDSLVKERTKTMVKTLMPEFKYVKIKHSGVVVLKKRWFSFKKTITSITDLYVNTLPKVLASKLEKKGYGKIFYDEFYSAVFVTLKVKAYQKEFDIVGFFWDRFNKYYRGIPDLYFDGVKVGLQLSYNRYLPVLSIFSSNYIPFVTKLIKASKKNGTAEYILEKIAKIKSKSREILSLPTHQISLSIS